MTLLKLNLSSAASKSHHQCTLCPMRFDFNDNIGSARDCQAVANHYHYRHKTSLPNGDLLCTVQSSTFNRKQRLNLSKSGAQRLEESSAFKRVE